MRSSLEDAYFLTGSKKSCTGSYYSNLTDLYTFAPDITIECDT